MNDWPHQITGFRGVLDALDRGVRRVCLTSPTGGGKTRIVQQIALAILKRNSVALYSNRRMMIEQLSAGLAQAGILHGNRSAGAEELEEHPFQVCSLQTETARVLKRRRGTLHACRPGDLAVFDEGHLHRGPKVMEIRRKHIDGGACTLDVTATPLGMGATADELIVAGTNSELRACGALVPAVHFGPDEPDMKAFKKLRDGEDPSEAEQKKAIMTPGIMGRVWKWFNATNPERRPTLLFAPGVAESLWFAQQFVAHGVPAAHVDGEDVWLDGAFHKADQGIRDQLRERSRDGSIKVVTNRFVLREGIDCLDSETEILTADGWRGIGGIAPGDRVYSLNRKSERMEFDFVQRCIDRLVNPGEKMLTIKSQHANLRVTEGHEIHFKYSHKWLTQRAGELARRRSDYALPISAVLAHDDDMTMPVADDELRLIAWFMTDGGFEQNYLCISQSKDYHLEIAALLLRLRLDFREVIRKPGKGSYPNARPLHRFLIPKGTHGGGHRRRGWWRLAEHLDKRGAPTLRLMSRRQFGVFWAELLKGDGSNRTATKSGALWCNLKSQADLYMELAVTRGYAANCLEQVTPNGATMYVVRCRDSQWLNSRPSDKRSARMELLPAIEGERVWCLTTSNGTIVTRRHGKVAILGNCPWVSHIVMACLFGSLQSYLQTGGRGLRACQQIGKECCTIQDHGGNFWRHGSLNEDRHWNLDFTDSMAVGLRAERCRTGKQKEPFVCPECKRVWVVGKVCSCGYVLENVKRSRAVVGTDGTCKELSGNVFQPRRVSRLPNGPELWERMYWRSRTGKGARTFAAAAALFAYENQWGWPSREWPFMPEADEDYFRLVKDVPMDRLTQGETCGQETGVRA